MVLDRLAALPFRDRLHSDEALLSGFLALPQIRQAGTILLYCGMGREPDTLRLLSPLLDAGKKVCLPRCLPGNRMETRLVQKNSRLVRHPYGMLEPDSACPIVPAGEIGLALVPGLAFDRSGGRLGRGGGYYDRWLAGFSGRTVALCREIALLDVIPRMPHDLGVELVITETGLYGPSAPAAGESGA